MNLMPDFLAGVAQATRDLRLFGRETRPVHLMLRYASDPTLPGLSGSEEACISFLQSLGVPLKSGERWLSWGEMDPGDRGKIASALTVHLVKRGAGAEGAKRLIGEVYVLSREEPRTELRSAKEYATLLNSCGRYDKAPVGLAVCKGDRDEAMAAARKLLGGHRRNLVEYMGLVRELGIRTRGSVQYFDGGDKVLDSVVGIVAGMILGSGEMEVDPAKPLFGIADSSDDPGMAKVSGRTTRRMVQSGVNLGRAMAEAAAQLEGVGGGHDIAAGAKVPRGKEMEFLDKVSAILEKRSAGSGQGSR